MESKAKVWVDPEGLYLANVGTASDPKFNSSLTPNIDDAYSGDDVSAGVVNNNNLQYLNVLVTCAIKLAPTRADMRSNLIESIVENIEGDQDTRDDDAILDQVLEYLKSEDD